MAFTYDVDTDRGKVRLLIADTSSSAYIFEDDEIDAFINLGLVSGEADLYLAAAFALEVMATNETMILKRISILDLSTDGVSVAKELRERAKDLRALSEEDASYDIVEFAWNDFNKRQITINRSLRDE